MILESDDNREWIIMDSDDEELNTELSHLNIKSSRLTAEKQFSKDQDYYVLLSIDIGIVHLGMALLTYDKKTYKFRETVGIDLIDITTFPHPPEVDRCQCKLHHTKTFTDWMEHIFQYYETIFTGVDKILIERQPPMGLVAIEQLIYTKYRNKCELIAPNSMHKFFHIGKFDYLIRKEKVEKIAKSYIIDPDIVTELDAFERQHDISDAICLGIFWLDTRHSEYITEQKMAAIRINSRGCPKGMCIDEYLAQFRYVPKKRKLSLDIN